MKKVSVIIPVYNVEKYIRQCLDSVVNQTLPDIEIICVDDGSTDMSLEILHEYAKRDNRIKVLEQSNQGASEARNKGMAIAKGEYIGFVDSDDWVDENYYETLYTKAVKENADIVRTTYKHVYGQTLEDEPANSLVTDKCNKNENIKRDEISYVIWNQIYKTKFLRENAIAYFDKNLKYVNDQPFIIRTAFSSNKISAAVNTNYYYRRNRAGQLVTPSIERFTGEVDSKTISIEFLNKTNASKEEYIAVYKQLILGINSRFDIFINNAGFTFDKQITLINKFRNLLLSCKYKDELDKLTKTYPELELIIKDKAKSYILYKKGMYKPFNFYLKQLLSITNSANKTHKIITIMGVKLKFKLAKERTT